MSKAPEAAMDEGRKAFGKCEEVFDGFDFNPDDMLIELPESVLAKLAHVESNKPPTEQVPLGEG